MLYVGNHTLGMDYIGPFTFLTMRAVLAVPFLIVLLFVMERNPAETIKKWRDPKLWKAGFICGISLFVAAGLQQVGIVHTTAGKAGSPWAQGGGLTQSQASTST